MPSLLGKALGLLGLTSKASQASMPHDYKFGAEDLIEHALFGSLQVSPSTAMSFYRQSSAIATAVDLIASKLETIQPVIEIDGELREQDEVTDFLVKPNDFAMWRGFVGKAARDLLLTGNNYFIGLGTVNLPPVEVYSVSPIDIHPFSTTSDGFPDRYSFAGQLAPGAYTREPRPGGGVRFIDGPLRQLYHIKGYSSRPNHLVGDSPIESILLEIRQHIAGRQHNEAMLRKGGRLSLLFIVKEMLGDKAFRELADRLRGQFGGAKKAGSVATISGKDMDVKEMGVNNKDMDFVNLDEVTKAAIFSRYNIPLPLIAASRQTFSNYAEAVEALYDDAVIPLVEILFEGLTDFLLPRFGRDPRTERITYDPQSILPLRQRMLAELKEAAALNVLTMNEQRAKLPNIGEIEGGDVVLGPATLVPIAGDGIDLALMTQEDREVEAENRRLIQEETTPDNDNPDDDVDDEDEAA